MSAIKPRSSSSSRSARVRLVVLFSRKRESSKERKSARLHERERERNDPFEPDDDDDAKISLTFFLSLRVVSLSKHTRLYVLLDPQKKTNETFFFLSLVFLALFLLASSPAARQKAPLPKTRSRDYTKQILLLFFFFFFFLARKKKHFINPKQNKTKP